MKAIEEILNHLTVWPVTEQIILHMTFVYNLKPVWCLP